MVNKGQGDKDDCGRGSSQVRRATDDGADAHREELGGDKDDTDRELDLPRKRPAGDKLHEMVNSVHKDIVVIFISRRPAVVHSSRKAGRSSVDSK